MEGNDAKQMVVLAIVVDGDDPEEGGRLANAAHKAVADVASGGVELADYKIYKLHAEPMFPEADDSPPDASMN